MQLTTEESGNTGVGGWGPFNLWHEVSDCSVGQNSSLHTVLLLPQHGCHHFMWVWVWVSIVWADSSSPALAQFQSSQSLCFQEISGSLRSRGAFIFGSPTCPLFPCRWWIISLCERRGPWLLLSWFLFFFFPHQWSTKLKVYLPYRISLLSQNVLEEKFLLPGLVDCSEVLPSLLSFFQTEEQAQVRKEHSLVLITLQCYSKRC